MKTTISKALLISALLLAAAWSLPGPAPAAAQTTVTTEEEAMMQRTISVSGTGSASTQPDMAVVTVGVTSEATEASDALTQNSTQMASVIDALKKGGVLAKDIRTQTIRLSPRYEQPPRTAGGAQKPPELVGFVANNVVEARVRELADLGDLLDAAVQAGGNQIQGIRFEIAPAPSFAQWADRWSDGDPRLGFLRYDVSDDGQAHNHRPQPRHDRPCVFQRYPKLANMRPGSHRRRRRKFVRES